jgi:hypothetical protein
MLGKMARSDPRPSARVTRGAGSCQHLASVLQEGRENANIEISWLEWSSTPGRTGRSWGGFGLRQHAY